MNVIGDYTNPRIVIPGIDINECADSQNNCSSNALCNNTIGSYTCACKIGFTGDGINCQGEKNYRISSITKQ